MAKQCGTAIISIFYTKVKYPKYFWSRTNHSHDLFDRKNAPKAECTQRKASAPLSLTFPNMWCGYGDKTTLICWQNSDIREIVMWLDDFIVIDNSLVEWESVFLFVQRSSSSCRTIIVSRQECKQTKRNMNFWVLWWIFGNVISLWSKKPCYARP